MNAIDYIILGIIILAAIVGAMRGFVNQAGTIVGIVLGIIACRFAGSAAADYIVTPGTEHEALYRTLVYALVFVAVVLAVKLVAGLFTKVISALNVRIIDRVAGAAFCAAAWTLLMSVVLNIYLAAAPSDRGVFEKPDKPWRTAVAVFAPKVMGYITTEQKK